MSASLLFLIVSFCLFAGYFSFTVIEAQTGLRVLDGVRRKFDRRLRRTTFIISHVDWNEFLAHLVRSGMERALHDIAHLTLLSVRLVERQLTRAVRYLRDRRPNVLAPSPSRSSMLDQALDYIKENLYRSRTKTQTDKKSGE